MDKNYFVRKQMKVNILLICLFRDFSRAGAAPSQSRSAVYSKVWTLPGQLVVATIMQTPQVSVNS